MQIELYNRCHSEGGGTPTAGIRILWMSGLQETGGTDCRAALAMTRLSEDCKNYKYHVKFDILHILCAGCAIVCMSTGKSNPEKKKGENAMLIAACVAAAVLATAAFIIIL